MSVLSILQVAMTEPSDAFLAELNDKVDKLFIISRTAAATTLTRRGQFVSRDTAALYQGIKLPPHLEVLAEVVSLKNTLDILTNLARITKQAGEHISRQETHRTSKGPTGPRDCGDRRPSALRRPEPCISAPIPNRYASYRDRRQRTLCERLGKDGVSFLNEGDGLK